MRLQRIGSIRGDIGDLRDRATRRLVSLGVDAQAVNFIHGRRLLAQIRVRDANGDVGSITINNFKAFDIPAAVQAVIDAAKARGN